MGFLDKLFGRKKKKEEAAVEEPVVTEEKKEAEEARTGGRVYGSIEQRGLYRLL